MKEKKEITVYILCGGKSSRMKTEKGLVKYHDKTFMEWILDAVKPISNTIFLVTKNSSYKKFGYPLIGDIYEDKGPVGGIYTALFYSDTTSNLILSCDIPKISTTVLEHLIVKSAFAQTEATFLSDGKTDYPLVGVYSKKALSIFATAIKKDALKLLELIKKLEHKRIVLERKDQVALCNINSKKELENLNKYELR